MTAFGTRPRFGGSRFFPPAPSRPVAALSRADINRLAAERKARLKKALEDKRAIKRAYWLTQGRGSGAPVASDVDARVLREVARKYGLTVEELVSARQTPLLVHARCDVADRLIDVFGRTGAHVAKLLNRSPSTISRRKRHNREDSA